MKYYIHNLSKNSVYVCKDFDTFIRYFASSNSNVWYTNKKVNTALEDIAMNYNDVKTTYDFAHGAQVVQRSIMVIDEYGRIIDPRHYKKEIENYVFPKSENYHWRIRGPFVFRNGPVPGIHRRRSHRGSYYRHPKTTQERRLSCDNEIKEFIKPSRNLRNLPDVWDEISRNRDHCWKAKKVKKQWMKHI
ncbi:hypothetical protein D3C81_96230 [compost metagenome]